MSRSALGQTLDCFSRKYFHSAKPNEDSSLPGLLLYSEREKIQFDLTSEATRIERKLSNLLLSLWSHIKSAATVSYGVTEVFRSE